MPRKTLRRGIGAKCTILKWFLHSKHAIDTNTYYQNKQDIDGLLIISRGKRKINKKQVIYCLFRNNRFHDNIILYCVEKFANVVKESAAEHFFYTRGSAGASATTNMNVNVNVNLSTENLVCEEQEGAITFRITTVRVDDQEDITLIQNMRFDIDDNNEPAQENAPYLQEQQLDHQNNHSLLLDHK